VDTFRDEGLLATESDDELQEGRSGEQPSSCQPSAADDLHTGLVRVVHRFEYRPTPGPRHPRYAAKVASDSIALARESDRAVVLELLEGQFRELEIETPAARLAAAVDGVFEDPSRGSLLLAWRDGRAVGLAYLSFQWTLEHGGRIAWLEELFVRPERRAQGIGGELLRAALAHASSTGCLAVDLEVEEAHEKASNLYRRAGFVALRRHRFYQRLSRA
jgi:GNAT superfamily N-acetyltransferase